MSKWIHKVKEETAVADDLDMQADAWVQYTYTCAYETLSTRIGSSASVCIACSKQEAIETLNEIL